jgi:hypothetical protein
LNLRKRRNNLVWADPLHVKHKPNWKVKRDAEVALKRQRSADRKMPVQGSSTNNQGGNKLCKTKLMFSSLPNRSQWSMMRWL